MVVAIVAFFFLPDTPGSARFLTEEEKWLAAHRLRLDLHGAVSADNVEEEKFSRSAVRSNVFLLSPRLAACG